MDQSELKLFLDEKSRTFNNESFIDSDPISIPKRFSRLQDIEIIGLWTAILSWGQRKTIINSGMRLIELMDGAPYDFVMGHSEKELARFDTFVHRTFQPVDALYFVDFFKNYYAENESLEDAFMTGEDSWDAEKGLIQFQKTFFQSEYAPQRTRKHIASPERNSSCKRLNMFLRWMVRDDAIVDFGLWKRLDKAGLYIPLDVHVQRVAHSLGLLDRKIPDWKAVKELTSRLRAFDAADPVKYDFALFGLGILQYDDLKNKSARAD